MTDQPEPEDNDVAGEVFGMIYEWWPVDVAFDVDRPRIQCTRCRCRGDRRSRVQHRTTSRSTPPNPVLRLVDTSRRRWRKLIARRKAKTPTRLRLILEHEAVAK